MPDVHDLTPDAWIDLIVRRSKEMRDAGVTSVAIGEVHVTLAPPELAPLPQPSPGTLKEAGEESHVFLDPLDDPKTYGRMSGTPGFTPPKRKGRS